MITQETYKREKRRLAIAQGRFERARSAAREWPNLYSSELEGKGIQALEHSVRTAVKLFDVAREGLDIFARDGFPDSWARWDSAERDAAEWIHRYRDLYEEIYGLTPTHTEGV